MNLQEASTEIRLQQLEAVAIDRITAHVANSVYVAHSGGKDSVVVHHLAKKALGKGVPIIHTPKITGFNAVHPDTIDFIYRLAADHVLHMVPGVNMRWFLERMNLKVQVDGTRRDECDRTDRSSDVVIDGANISRSEMPAVTYDGLFGQTSVFPIVDWSDDDVWSYIAAEGLEVSAEYPVRASH